MTPPDLHLTLALFGNLDITEILVIALFAVMIFGRNLPRVAAQAVTHVSRARRALQQVWRESGIGEEVREVQREIEASTRKLKDADPRRALDRSVRELDAEIRSTKQPELDPGTPDPDAARAEDSVLDGGSQEPEAERNRVPSWYPQTLQTPSSDDFDEEDGVPTGQGISPGGLMPPKAEPAPAPEAPEADDDPQTERPREA